MVHRNEYSEKRLTNQPEEKKNQIALISKLYSEKNNLHTKNNLAILLTKIKILKGFLESEIKLFSQSIHF